MYSTPPFELRTSLMIQRCRQVNTATSPYLEYYNRAVMPLRRAICSAFGHQRSRLAAREVEDVWYSVCERCECALRRDAPKTWREVPEEDYTNARESASTRWEGQPAKRVATSAQHGAKEGKAPSSKQRSAKPRGYNVDYFAHKHGITRKDARQIMDQVGNSREKLNAAAKVFKLARSR